MVKVDYQNKHSIILQSYCMYIHFLIESIILKLSLSRPIKKAVGMFIVAWSKSQSDYLHIQESEMAMEWKGWLESEQTK